MLAFKCHRRRMTQFRTTVRFPDNRNINYIIRSARRELFQIGPWAKRTPTYCARVRLHFCSHQEL